mmetsp:Transcript_21571/g.51113  ORF Transcript_21571/g.51113 Transcript_21571/m.51113 type:complete len:338 (-) Transcript_21571:245-1258(-)
MVSLRNSFPAFLMSLALASGVQADLVCPPTENLGVSTCANTSGNGNTFTTYGILCDKTWDGSTATALTNTVTKTGATFSTLCGLLEAGPFITPTGTVDLITYINTSGNLHTFFAPTDVAFTKNQAIVDYLSTLALQTDSASIALYHAMVLSILQLHILPGTYLMDDLVCDCVYDTIDLTTALPQKSKTKCRGPVTAPKQIGPGNTAAAEQPTIGYPVNVFTGSEFSLAVTGSNFNRPETVTSSLFSSNVIGCNGVIHSVDNLLIAGDSEFASVAGHSTSSMKSGKATKDTKAGKSMKGGRRRAESQQTPEDREENRERRRARLEALLEPSGDVQQLN